MGKRGSKKGGGGMKGFMKQNQKLKDEEESVSSEVFSEASSDDPVLPPTKTVVEKPSGGDHQQESKSQMRERHHKEMNSAKKVAANMGKKKKKEANLYLEEIKQRHQEELSNFPKEDPVEKDLPEETEELKTVVEKKSKSQKRREKEAQRELDRELRIREEVEKLGETETQIEQQKLESKLNKSGFEIFEIRPDGHCLYRAIEHQLSKEWTVDILRREAAEELRTSMDSYLPFFVYEGEDTEQAFLDYCMKVETSAEWGGELEIQALAKRLHQQFVIFSAEFPENIIGTETSNLEEKSPIRLCLMQHAYHLGAHYNSVIKQTK